MRAYCSLLLPNNGFFFYCDFQRAFCMTHVCCLIAVAKERVLLLLCSPNSFMAPIFTFPPNRCMSVLLSCLSSSYVASIFCFTKTVACLCFHCVYQSVGCLLLRFCRTQSILRMFVHACLFAFVFCLKRLIVYTIVLCVCIRWFVHYFHHAQAYKASFNFSYRSLICIVVRVVFIYCFLHPRRSSIGLVRFYHVAPIRFYQVELLCVGQGIIFFVSGPRPHQ